MQGALLDFQHAHGIAQTGDVDPDTQLLCNRLRASTGISTITPSMAACLQYIGQAPPCPVIPIILTTVPTCREYHHQSTNTL